MIPLAPRDAAASQGDAADGFDAVREMLKEVRERSLRAHVWIDVTLAAYAGELPGSRDHVLYQHPEWLMVPRELAGEILGIDVRSPAYLGRLARWTRLNTQRTEGMYVSPLDPDAAAYLATKVVDAVKRYTVDGVFLDGVRFPGADFDYSKRAMEIFRAERRPALTLAERIRLDDVEAIDSFGYTEEFPEEWRTFRQTKLTALLARVSKALHAVNPALVVSAGIAADPSAARLESFQDWPSWMETGLIDGVGRRNGTSGTIVFSADGLSATASPLPINQTPEAQSTR
jgi:uncharacterized lipoprotein YddW (UPF0748 family)